MYRNQNIVNKVKDSMDQFNRLDTAEVQSRFLDGRTKLITHYVALRDKKEWKYKRGLIRGRVKQGCPTYV